MNRVQDTRRAVQESLDAVPPPDPPECALCDDRGFKMPGGAPCSCPTGRIIHDMQVDFHAREDFPEPGTNRRPPLGGLFGTSPLDWDDDYRWEEDPNYWGDDGL